jgi:hypothetical protein
VDEFHQRLIRIGLDALAADDGYALAGGYAVQAHHFIDRLSDDVDLFVPIERKHEMPTATARIIAAYDQAGLRAQIRQHADTYVRLDVTDPAIGRTVKVELVAEFLMNPPVPSDLGPVLHPDDVAAGKLEALFTRAEVRDFIDVDALLRGGYNRSQLIELAKRRDAGFDESVLADMFASLHRLNDRQFAVYGIDAAAIQEIRDQFKSWQQEIRDRLKNS